MCIVCELNIRYDINFVSWVSFIVLLYVLQTTFLPNYPNFVPKKIVQLSQKTNLIKEVVSRAG